MSSRASIPEHGSPLLHTAPLSTTQPLQSIGGGAPGHSDDHGPHRTTPSLDRLASRLGAVRDDCATPRVSRPPLPPRRAGWDRSAGPGMARCLSREPSLESSDTSKRAHFPAHLDDLAPPHRTDHRRPTGSYPAGPVAQASSQAVPRPDHPKGALRC